MPYYSQICIKKIIIHRVLGYQCVFSVNKHSKYIWYRMLVQGLHNKNCENANGSIHFFFAQNENLTE